MTQNKSIVLGGGCFWCLEASYQLVDGVGSVVPGYVGGSIKNPRYEQVITGQTGHVEVVRVVYNPEIVSLEQILGVFWIIHDPTSLNQQGADVGSQYASVIFSEDNEDTETIKRSLGEAQQILDSPIVTRVEKLEQFYEAESYHHHYFENNPDAGYCQVVIEPKLSKLRQHFAPLLRP